MNCLDITSLYTNIRIKMPQLSCYSFKKNSIQFIIPINTLIDIYKYITNMIYFKFYNKFYKQKSGLPMGNPLSGVLACLFLEFLESAPFKYKLPSNTAYFRYIDDIIISLFKKTSKLKRLLRNISTLIYLYICMHHTHTHTHTHTHIYICIYIYIYIWVCVWYMKLLDTCDFKNFSKEKSNFNCFNKLKTLSEYIPKN